MRYDKWNMPDHEPRAPEDMGEGYTPLLAAVLCARGFGDAERAQDYINCGEENLHDPLLLAGMGEAVGRLALAIEEGERVAVYGDYDVDGITSSCLVADYLRSRGLDPILYIPDRVAEGYGLNEPALRSLAERGVTLIVTVDCGGTAVAEVRYASSLGMDMIITDHHEGGGELPEAVAVINPKRPDCDYPARSLAGVGVAFKLICAVHGDAREIVERYSDIIAVGTVADVMPLVGENRYLVRRGIEKLKTDPCPGLGALICEAGVDAAKINSVSIGFALAPRINAAGRLGLVQVASSLLLTNDAGEAQALAKKLCALNRCRQELEGKIWREAQLEIGPAAPGGPIVLAREGWHQGVIGIVASRIVENYGVPAVMISLDDESGKGSCRSSGGWNLFDALSSCAKHLESFGGHAMAAGLTIKRGSIDGFREDLGRCYREAPPSSGHELDVDFVVPSDSMLSLGCVTSLERMEPYGQGNPRPQLALLDAVIESVVPLAGGRHVRLYVGKFYQTYECVFFSKAYDEFEFHAGDSIDIVFFPQVNEYRGRKSVQFLITDVREAEIYSRCRRALSASLPREEAEGSIPQRPDFARLWRKVSSLAAQTSPEAEPSYTAGFHTAMRELGTGRNHLMTAIGLSVLAELGLIEYAIQGSEFAIKILDPGKKVNLQESRILGGFQADHMANNITPAAEKGRDNIHN